ncbi:hypothetical protein EVG20_g10445, partial [Dentipellis fragilis]
MKTSGKHYPPFLRSSFSSPTSMTTPTPTETPTETLEARIERLFGPDTEEDRLIRKEHTLCIGEKWWRDHYGFLSERGYTLRQRLHPEWTPPWRRTERSWKKYEDGQAYDVGVMDAIRKSDGSFVALKKLQIVGGKSTVEEIEINRYLSSEPLASNPRNRCATAIEIFEVPDEKNIYILVMPLLRPIDNPLFDTFGEAVAFFTQIFEYYFIDYGLSEHYHPGRVQPWTWPPLELPVHGGDKSVPEHQGEKYDVLCDPFPADIYLLGNLIRESFIEKYHGFGFTEELVADMVQDDPSQRPDINEVVSRFAKIRASLSSWKLRSRTIRRKEWKVVTLWRFPPHLVRTIRCIVTRTPAIPDAASRETRWLVDGKNQEKNGVLDVVDEQNSGAFVARIFESMTKAVFCASNRHRDHDSDLHPPPPRRFAHDAYSHFNTQAFALDLLRAMTKAFGDTSGEHASSTKSGFSLAKILDGDNENMEHPNVREDSDSDDAAERDEKNGKEVIEGYCVECEDQPAEVHCEVCSDDFCDVCFSALHRKGTRKRHATKPLGQRREKKAKLSSNGAAKSVETAEKMDTDDDDDMDEELEHLASAAASSADIHLGLQPAIGHDPGEWFVERSKFIPLRLTLSERKYLRLLDAALQVSEYTDKIDTLGFGLSKAKRVVHQIRELCAVLAGLVLAADYKQGQELFTDRDFEANSEFYQRVFELGRRHKIMNPDKMRTTYGKLIYMLQDSQTPEVTDMLSFSCVSPIRTVHTLLETNDALNMLRDPIVTVATQEIIAEGRSRREIQKAIK